MYFILGIVLILAGWKLTGERQQGAVELAEIGTWHITWYHGLFVLGALSLIKGFFKWVNN